MAVYRVTEKASGKKTLVETRTKAGAISHVSKSAYEVEALNTSELLKETRAGTEIITVLEETESKEGVPAMVKNAAAAKEAAKTTAAAPAAGVASAPPLKTASGK